MLFIILGFLIGALTLRAFTWLTLRLVKALAKPQKTIDAKTTRFIEGIKAKIPMAGAILRGQLEEELKEEARKEVLKSLSEIESQIAPLIYLIGGIIGILISIINKIILYYY